jgi:Tol biopolymer transport system component
VWNADGSGDPIILEGYSACDWFPVWSPDGKHILVPSIDRAALIWSLDVSERRQQLGTASTDCLQPRERETYLAETEAEACDGYETCERTHGRSPRSCGGRQ